MINMLDAHVSQFYEWLPWTAGELEQVPKDPAERKKWLGERPMAERTMQPEWREALEKRRWERTESCRSSAFAKAQMWDLTGRYWRR